MEKGNVGRPKLGNLTDSYHIKYEKEIYEKLNLESMVTGKSISKIVRQRLRKSFETEPITFSVGNKICKKGEPNKEFEIYKVDCILGKTVYFLDPKLELSIDQEELLREYEFVPKRESLPAKEKIKLENLSDEEIIEIASNFNIPPIDEYVLPEDYPDYEEPDFYSEEEEDFQIPVIDKKIEKSKPQSQLKVKEEPLFLIGTKFITKKGDYEIWQIKEIDNEIYYFIDENQPDLKAKESQIKEYAIFIEF